MPFQPIWIWVFKVHSLHVRLIAKSLNSLCFASIKCHIYPRSMGYLPPPFALAFSAAPAASGAQRARDGHRLARRDSSRNHGRACLAGRMGCSPPVAVRAADFFASVMTLGVSTRQCPPGVKSRRNGDGCECPLSANNGKRAAHRWTAFSWSSFPFGNQPMAALRKQASMPKSLNSPLLLRREGRHHARVTRGMGHGARRAIRARSLDLREWIVGAA